MTEPLAPIACNLTTKDAAAQAVEWVDLSRLADSIEPVPNGVRMAFPVEHSAGVQALARREAECCGFMSLLTTRTPTSILLEITSEHPDAAPVIALLSGLRG